MTAAEEVTLFAVVGSSKGRFVSCREKAAQESSRAWQAWASFVIRMVPCFWWTQSAHSARCPSLAMLGESTSATLARRRPSAHLQVLLLLVVMSLAIQDDTFLLHKSLTFMHTKDESTDVAWRCQAS